MTAVRMLVLVLALLAQGGLATADGNTPPPEKKAASSADDKAIRTAVLAYLETLRLMRGVTVEVEAVRGAYARARTVPPPDTTDPAWVFAKKSKGRWTVVLGPGTSFEEAELTKLGVPRELWLTPAP